MKDFCSNIRETAKMRGLTRGAVCRDNGYRNIMKSIEPKNIIENVNMSFDLGSLFDKESDKGTTINITINL